MHPLRRRVLDANTLWDFREALIAAGALEALFTRLDRAITGAGYLPMAGQIVAATLVAAPRQRNTEAEKARIKAGERYSNPKLLAASRR
jgi:IS5 family transposase